MQVLETVYGKNVSKNVDSGVKILRNPSIVFS